MSFTFPRYPNGIIIKKQDYKEVCKKLKDDGITWTGKEEVTEEQLISLSQKTKSIALYYDRGIVSWSMVGEATRSRFKTYASTTVKIEDIYNSL